MFLVSYLFVCLYCLLFVCLFVCFCVCLFGFFLGRCGNELKEELWIMVLKKCKI